MKVPSIWAPNTLLGRALPQGNDNVNHVVALSQNIYSDSDSDIGQFCAALCDFDKMCIFCLIIPKFDPSYICSSYFCAA